MNPQLTEAVAKALQSALEDAQTRRLTEVSEAGLLKTLFEDPQGYFSTFASCQGLGREELIKKLEAALKKSSTYEGTAQQPAMSTSIQTLFQEAQSIAKKWSDSYIASDH